MVLVDGVSMSIIIPMWQLIELLRCLKKFMKNNQVDSMR